MSKTPQLTTQDVLHISNLVNIKLSPDELISFTTQLVETVSYVKNLDELDTSSVEPTSHSTKASNVFFEDGTQNKRQFSSSEAVSQAIKKQDSMFVVDRIME